MKRFFCVLFSITLLALSCQFLTACNGGEDEGPKYSETYTYNETLHWRNQINGSGRTDVAEHQNDKGVCYCGKYFDASEYLTYVKINYNGQLSYAVYSYDGTNPNAYLNIEIPAYHQEPGDEQALPVVAINAYIFSPTKNLGYDSLKSVKLNEGLKLIGNGAFTSTSIKEVVVPNSVTGGFNSISGVSFDEEGNQVGVGRVSYWPSSQGLYNVFGGCKQLKRAVIGNGVTTIEGYLFSSCDSLEEVVLGSSVRTIKQRSFYECTSLKKIVIPSLVTSIPESSIYASNIDKYQALTCVFAYVREVFLEFSKEEYKARSIRKQQRDELTGYYVKDGQLIHPDDWPGTTYGIVEGWCGMADIYYEGEWHYDSNGQPVPN